MVIEAKKTIMIAEMNTSTKGSSIILFMVSLMLLPKESPNMVFMD